MKLIQILKPYVPAALKYRIKMGKEIITFAKKMKAIEMNPSANAYLIGTPIHTNLGDHLITLGEYEYVNSINPSYKIEEVPTEMFQIYKTRLKNAIPVDIPIFINGGGWMGNIWPVEELLLQEIVDTFSDHKIIIFPQTIYFDKEVKPYDAFIKSANNIFSRCNNITLFVRDRKSYEFAVENYKDIDVLLVPDIALAYYEKAPKNNMKGTNKIVGFCLRDDRELFRDSNQEKMIRGIFKKLGYEERIVTTMYRKRVATTNRISVVRSTLNDFANCSVIVTDRLHGMIFSFITGTPCIILDNKTKKVSGVYNEWLRDCSYIFALFNQSDCTDIERFICKIANDEKKLEPFSIKEKFYTLKEKING